MGLRLIQEQSQSRVRSRRRSSLRDRSILAEMYPAVHIPRRGGCCRTIYFGRNTHTYQVIPHLMSSQPISAQKCTQPTVPPCKSPTKQSVASILQPTAHAVNCDLGASRTLSPLTRSIFGAAVGGTRSIVNNPVGPDPLHPAETARSKRCASRCHDLSSVRCPVSTGSFMAPPQQQGTDYCNYRLTYYLTCY